MRARLTVRQRSKTNPTGDEVSDPDERFLKHLFEIKMKQSKKKTKQEWQLYKDEYKKRIVNNIY